MNIFCFLSSSLTVNWLSLGCGQNKTFEDVVFGFGKHWSTFLLINQDNNRAEQTDSQPFSECIKLCASVSVWLIIVELLLLIELRPWVHQVYGDIITQSLTSALENWFPLKLNLSCISSWGSWAFVCKRNKRCERGHQLYLHR